MKKVISFFGNLSTKARGILLSLFLSICVLYFFFGAILSSPNKYYFDRSGEGLLSYYCATYHLKYDSTYWHLQAMNYPHGENVFFTSNQPIVCAVLKFINNNIFTVENYVPGIFNLIMLFSVVLCALFLFLIFHELKIQYVFAALSAVGIAFLCSDVTRMRGHFALGYTFTIPALFYLIMLYDKQPNLKKSIGVGLFVFIMSGMHLYYFGICASILLIYFFTKIFTKDKFFVNLKNIIIALFIQVALPVLLLQVLIHISDDVNDRTTHPWGFLEYVSSFDGIFFPFNKPYEGLIEKFHPATAVSVEGLNYVGIFAILFSISFIIYKLFKRIKFNFKKTFFSIIIKFDTAPFLSNNKLLNTFLIIGIIMAIYSCAIPFCYNESLIQYFGFLTQMRSLGRFGWIFYYALNIFCIYVFYQWMTQLKWKYLNFIYIIPLFLLFYDGYYLVNTLSGFVHNKVPVLEDLSNDLPENKWLKTFDVKKYQAIIPLPYFLRGSENIGIEPNNGEIISQAYITSMKTGLPITSAVLSRTSMSQAIENLAMMIEPYRPLKIVSHFPNKKPFLLLVIQGAELSDWQKNLVNKATYLQPCKGFALYELPYSVLASCSDSLFEKKAGQISSYETFPINDWISTANKKNFAYKSFDELKSSLAYHGDGAYIGNIKEYNRIFEDTIPGGRGGQNYTLSFWMGTFNKDLYPRTTIEITYVDSASHPYYSYWVAAASLFKTFDDTWALIETTLNPTHGHDKILITLWNPEFYDDSKIIIDELLIRPQETDLFKIFPDEIEKNNRFYKGKYEKGKVVETLKTSRQETILGFIQQIKNNPEWLKQIKEKAKSMHKTLDEVIKNDAEFLMQEREKAEKAKRED